MTKIDTDTILECTKCKSSLFLNVGLRFMTKSAGHDTTTLGMESRYKGWEAHETVYPCAGCLTPYTNENGHLIDLSDRISQEDVQAALRTINAAGTVHERQRKGD